MAIHWHGERLEVEQILDAWRVPEGKCYRINTQDGQVFELRYSESENVWSVVQH